MSYTLINKDPYSEPFKDIILYRIKHSEIKEKELTGRKTLSEFANAHHYFGLHKTKSEWVYRDWLPNANEVYLIGDFSQWKVSEKYKLKKDDTGKFSIKLDNSVLKHGDLYRLFVKWETGSGDRIPAYAKRVVQDEQTKIFNAQVWFPSKPYKQKNSAPSKKDAVFIYEAHIGMASEEGKVASFSEFKDHILPKIHSLGYDTIQLMAIQEHPYYGSFGYHVSNFFCSFVKVRNT